MSHHPKKGKFTFSEEKLLFLRGGHTSGIQSVAFSPDCKFIASGSTDETIKLWDAQTRICIHTFKGHSELIYSIAFSPDGKYIVSSGGDNLVKIWDIISKQCQMTLEGHTDYVTEAKFFSCGKLLASASNDLSIIIWDLQTKECVITFQEAHTQTIDSIAISPNGTKIVSASHDQLIKIWDIDSKNCISILKEHLNTVNSVIFSIDGENIFSGSSDRTIKMWNINSSKCLFTIVGHKSIINELAISLDGKKLASASSDKRIKIWDIASQECLAILNGTAEMYSVNFSSDSKFIVSGCIEGTLEMWNLNTEEGLNFLEQVYKGDQNSIICVGDDQIITHCEDGTVQQWDISHKKLLNTFKVGQEYNDCFDCFKDGSAIAVSTSENIIQLWNMKENQMQKEFLLQDIPSFITISQDNSLMGVAFSYDRNILQIWDINSQKLIHNLHNQDDQLTFKLIFNKNSRYVISKESSYLKIWDLFSEKISKKIRVKDIKVVQFRASTKQIQQMTITSCGQKLLICRDSKILEVWNLKNMKRICRRVNSKHNLIKEGNLKNEIFTAGENCNEVRVWNLQTPQPIIIKQVQEFQGVLCLQVANNKCIIGDDSQQIIVCEVQEI